MNVFAFVLRLVLVLGVLFLIDLYAYQAFKTAFKDSNVLRFLYWGLSVILLIMIVISFLVFDRSNGAPSFFSFLMGVFILFVVPKLILLLSMFAEDVIRFVVGVVQKINGSHTTQFMPDRRKFISQVALGLAALPFAGILHGVLKGKYNYKVIKKTLYFKDLPKAFDGFTLTQISDVHSGSFDNAKKIQYGIDMINAQQSDMILFTGDLVNNKASEMNPWIDVFSQLKAPMGKFSVLGNHDYGDYISWESEAAKAQNMEQLYEVHKKIGFKLLRNESVSLEKNGAAINLVGVENWGAGGFAKHGDLDVATKDLADKSFNILMSHDPSHFDKKVKQHSKHMHLTLSGHTHGMQFGIEIPGWIKWSPVKYRYPKWAGLYEEAGKYLYVNRGFGFLAFPGRVGIWPEITVLELKREEEIV